MCQGVSINKISVSEQLRNFKSFTNTRSTAQKRVSDFSKMLLQHTQPVVQVLSLQEIFSCCPNIGPCNFYLRGYLKAEIFEHSSRTLEDLNTSNEEEVVQITSATLEKIMCFPRKSQYVYNPPRRDDIIFKSLKKLHDITILTNIFFYYFIFFLPAF